MEGRSPAQPAHLKSPALLNLVYLVGGLRYQLRGAPPHAAKHVAHSPGSPEIHRRNMRLRQRSRGSTGRRRRRGVYLYATRPSDPGGWPRL